MSRNLAAAPAGGLACGHDASRPPAVLLTELLAPARVVLPLRGSTKPAVMRELLAAAMPDASPADLDAVMDALLARESVLSTGIGDGVAIPHAKTPKVERLVMAAGVAVPPVDFDALDGQPADLFFLLLGPDSAATEHVKALGRLARVLRKPGLSGALRAAASPAEFVGAIADTEAG